MKLRVIASLAAVLLGAAPAASRADLTTYGQNFESMVMADPAALSSDGWLVYGNVFSPGLVYLYGYGPFPAPNGGTAFSSIDAGQGGAEQGAQQLSVYSDYNNADHANGNLVESNVYREQVIGAADIGETWVFAFDAKLGNLVAPTTAVAFIKTLAPPTYTLTNFISVNTTAIPPTWSNYSISITIDAGLVGQILQIGFASTATNYVSSGVFYDNISWAEQIATGVGHGSRLESLELRAAPNPFVNSTRIDYAMAQAGPADVSVYDVTGRRVATIFRGELEPGPQSASWNGRFADGRRAPAGVYRAVVQTAAGTQSRNLVLTH
jgi:hypothetical protein